MNIYTLDKDLVKSLAALDNRRFIIQGKCLTTILRQSILKSPELMDIAESSMMLSNDTIRMRLSQLLPPSFDNHPVQLWANSTLLNVMWLLYYHSCFTIIASNRNIRLNSEGAPVRLIFNNVTAVLHNALMASSGDIADLPITLYKSIPKDITADTTIEAYRQYIIRHWKNDMVGYVKVNNPPTRTYFPSWRITPRGSVHKKLSAAPSWAIEELTAYWDSIKPTEVVNAA